MCMARTLRSPLFFFVSIAVAFSKQHYHLMRGVMSGCTGPCAMPRKRSSQKTAARRALRPVVVPLVSLPSVFDPPKAAAPTPKLAEPKPPSGPLSLKVKLAVTEGLTVDGSAHPVLLLPLIDIVVSYLLAIPFTVTTVRVLAVSGPTRSRDFRSCALWRPSGSSIADSDDDSGAAMEVVVADHASDRILAVDTRTHVPRVVCEAPHGVGEFRPIALCVNPLTNTILFLHTDSSGNRRPEDRFETDRVAELDPASGRITTLAGGTIQGFKDGDGTNAQFNSPRAIAVAPGGTFAVIADYGNHRIRRLELFDSKSTPADGGSGGARRGTVTTLVGTGSTLPDYYPQLLCGDPLTANISPPVSVCLESGGQPSARGCHTLYYTSLKYRQFYALDFPLHASTTKVARAKDEEPVFRAHEITAIITPYTVTAVAPYRLVISVPSGLYLIDATPPPSPPKTKWGTVCTRPRRTEAVLMIGHPRGVGSTIQDGGRGDQKPSVGDTGWLVAPSNGARLVDVQHVASDVWRSRDRGRAGETDGDALYFVDSGKLRVLHGALPACTV